MIAPAPWYFILPLLVTSIFLMCWGIIPKETEDFVKSFPKGDKVLHWLYSIEEKLSAEGRKRKQIRIKLAEYLEEGQKIMGLCGNQTVPAPLAEAQTWDATVSNYLRENLDESYVTRFGNHAGLPTPTTRLHMPEHTNVWIQIHTRIARLQEFITELRD